MSAPYEFSIGKGRMIQLVACLVAIQALLYSSGVATGLLLRPRAASQERPLLARVDALRKRAPKTAFAPVAATKPAPTRTVAAQPDAPVERAAAAPSPSAPAALVPAASVPAVGPETSTP